MNRFNGIVASILLLTVGTISFRFYQMQRLEKDSRDIRHLPMSFGEWSAKELTLTEREYEILETRNLVSREYRNPKGEQMNLFVIYSETNRRVCHPPIACLIGSGATVTHNSKRPFSLSNQDLPVNYLTTRDGDKRYVVVYWYMLGREFTEDYFTQQIRWVLRQAGGKGVGGALVRIITPLSGTEEETVERVRRFVETLLPHLTQEKRACLWMLSSSTIC